MVRQRNNCAIPFTMCLLSIVLLCGCISVTAARAATSHPIASLKESEIAPSAEKAPRSFWIKLTLGAIIRWGRRDVDSIKNETNEFFQTVTSGVHDGISRIVKFSIVMFNCSIVSYSNNFMNSTGANKSSGSSETEDFMVLTDSDGGLFQLNDEGDNQCEDLSIIILKVLKAVVIGIAVAILTALLLPLVLRLLLFIIGFITYGTITAFLIDSFFKKVIKFVYLLLML